MRRAYATHVRPPLRHRDFALYVGATVATAFAIEMSFVAIGWQVYSIHGDPLDLGLVGLAMFLPLRVAVNVAVGAAAGVTVAVRVTLPPGPVATSV